MKQKILILWLMLLAGASGLRAAEAYAFLSSDNKTLTFYYDNNRSSRTGGTTYGMNTSNYTPGWYSKAGTITNVVFNSSFAYARPECCHRWFASMTNLTSITNLSYLNTSQVTDMSNMFASCSSLESIDLSNFNTANVTNMNYMFASCSKLKSLDLSLFNTANVTDMGGMFYKCNTLANLDLSKFNTSKVTDMTYMFNSCSNLTSINMNNFDTSKVKSMACMFESCSNLSSLDVSMFNTSSVTNFNSMFHDCSKLTSIDVSNFNTSSSQGMMRMFSGCSNLKSLDLGSFTIKLNTTSMLANCSALKTLIIPLSASRLENTVCEGVGTQTDPCTLVYPEGFTPEKTAEGDGWYQWKSGYFKDASIEPYAVLSTDEKTLTFYYDKDRYSRTETTFDLNTDDLPEWFDNCTSIESVVFDSSFANARPTSCYAWFAEMQNLTSITGIKNLKTDEVTDMSWMFGRCHSLYSLDVSGFNTENVKNMRAMFYECYSLKSLDVSKFNTSNVTNMSYMFGRCSQLTSLDVSGFNTAKVNFMEWMFESCSNLTSLDVSNFNTAKVQDMLAMFSNCYRLKSLNVSGLNTSNVRDMSGMFQYCRQLTSLDVSGLNTANAKNLKHMFYYCTSLTSLDVSNFTFTDATNTEEILKECSSLKTLTIPATASLWNANACIKVGTEAAPCTLVYPKGFTPEKTAEGDGWYQWKAGYFTDGPKPYAVVDGSTLTFYYDNNYGSRNGTVYDLNEGNNAPGWNSNASSITTVSFTSSFDNARPTSCYRWFAGMSNFKTIQGRASFHTDNVTDMSYMFYGCTSLESSIWNTLKHRT